MICSDNKATCVGDIFLTRVLYVPKETTDKSDRGSQEIYHGLWKNELPLVGPR